MTTNANSSSEELELLGYLLEEEGTTFDDGMVVKPRPPLATVPLTFAQERLWFLDQWDPGNPASNIPFAVRLRGQLSVAALEQSLNEIVRRHEALRTTFPVEDGQPRHQVVAPALTIGVNRFDLRELPASDHEAAVQRLMQENAHHRFNLALGPLLRADLVCLSDKLHVFLLTIHHIVFDGWSVGLFLRELTVLYNACSKGEASPLPELAVQYPDFALWQRNWLQGEALDEQLTYWKEQLRGNLPVLELAGDYAHPPVLTYDGAVYYHQFSPELLAKLTRFSQHEGVTLFMTLFAAFQTLLYRYTGAEDIITGSPVANRDCVETEAVMGLFVNTLPLRTNLTGNPSFRAFLQRVRDDVLEGFARQTLPVEQIIDAIQPPRDTAHTPLFQVMFVLLNAPLPAITQDNIQIEALRVDNGTAKYDLTLSLTEMPNGLLAMMEYRTDLFEAATIARMVGHYQTLLEGILINPQQPISQLPLLTEAERRQFAAWNGATLPMIQQGGIHSLVGQQAARTPTHVALVDGTERMSYCDLNARANQLAHYLQSHGVGPEVCVGLCMARSAAMVIGLLAILKAGGAYVPLDPAYPLERLTFMLADSGAQLLLTAQGTAAAPLPLVATFAGHRIDLVADAGQLADSPTSDPSWETRPADLAYLIYTSGSTGRPKGVAITHRSVLALLAWAAQAYTSAQLAGVLASTSICFDLSVFEIFAPLSTGGTVILAEDALALPDLPAANAVTLLNSVPSVVTTLLRSSGLPPSVQTVNLAGEPLPLALVQQLYATGSVQAVYNLYGPSEDTTYSTVACIAPDATNVPIGVPLPNTQAYVLDAHMQPVPIGVPGELYLGGAGLARGYFNRPELTAERFLDVKFFLTDIRLLDNAAQSQIQNPKSKMYKTGDLVRYRPDGQLEFLGRSDHQVKLRGFRIEPGEIETVLAQHPAVRSATVVLYDDATGNPQLVAYIVTINAEPFDVAQGRRGTMNAERDEHDRIVHHSSLIAWLRERLPNYMVPTAFVVLEQFPLTPSGKVDRKALPALNQTSNARCLVLPRTPVEQLLASMWSEVLGRDPIGVDDNFFEIGGHSLKATQLLARVRATYQVDLQLRQLFSTPTVAGVAQIIETTLWASENNRLAPNESDDGVEEGEL